MGGGPAILTHARRLGGPVIAEELRARVASRDVNFGLRADLRRRPEVKPAAIPLTLEACGPGFRGFDDELHVATGRDYGRVLLRKRLHEAGVRTPHVALTPEGTPVYVQWLIGAEDQEALGRHASPAWAPLAEEQVMVEFAHTFAAPRGTGVLADAMARVL